VVTKTCDVSKREDVEQMGKTHTIFLRRFVLFALMVAVALTSNLAMIGTSKAQQAPSQATGQSIILINHARIFDGSSDQLKQGNLLIEERKFADDCGTRTRGSARISGGQERRVSVFELSRFV
jgi:hypothetical protein